MWCEWAQLCIHQVWCLYNFRYKETEWETSSHAQNIVTTSVLSSGELLGEPWGEIFSWPAAVGENHSDLFLRPLTISRRGFLCQESRLGLLYASRVFFILVASEPVTITEQQVSYEWWEQHKEGDSSRTWAEWGLYLWNEELCSVDFLSYKPDPLEKLEPQETIRVVLFCLDPTTDTKQIKTFLPCEKLFVTTDYRSCMSCCWFSCAAYSIFRPGHFRQLCSEL